MFALSIVPVLLTAQVKTIYVDSRNSGGDGRSWQTAYADLQEALADAGPGDEIWVARGVYFPTTGTDRQATFRLPAGVALRGGFEGTESSPEERPPVGIPVTRLSGAIGLPFDKSDNIQHVLYLDRPNEHTLLEGLLIEGAYALATGAQPGILSAANSGGGVYIRGTADTLARVRMLNCRFEGNFAAGYGAAIGGRMAFPTLINCHFENNKAGSGGAIGLFNTQPAPASEIRLQQCSFSGNEVFSGGYGGAVYLNNQGGSGHFIAENSRFEKNTLNGGRKTIYLQSVDSMNIVLRHCLFRENNEAFSYQHEQSVPARLGNLLIDNCSFFRHWRPDDGRQAGMILSVKGMDIQLLNSRFEGNYQGGMSIVYCNLIMEDNVYQDNREAFLSLHESNTYFRRCRFINNRTLRNGAVFDLVDIPFKYREHFFDNCVFAGNSAASNGGVFWIAASDARWRFNNCTFYGNHCRNGGVFYLNNVEDIEFNNCLFWNNYSGTHPGIGRIPNSKAVFNHCLVEAPQCELIAATDTSRSSSGAITVHDGEIICNDLLYAVDPHFVSPENLDFRLEPFSAAIDRGGNAVADSFHYVTDAAGASRINGGRIDLGAYEWQGFNATLKEVVSVSCAGAEDGVVAFQLSGLSPFTIQWADGQSSGERVDGLPAGDYHFTLTDAVGNRDSLWVNIPGKAPIFLPLVASPISCSDSRDGAVQVMPQGGIPPYTYKWNNGVQDSILQDIGPGTYTVIVTDSKGCRRNAGAVLEAPDSLQADWSVDPVSCFGGNDGRLGVALTGGVAPYRLKWDDNPLGNPERTNLPAGNYLISVTDSRACQAAFQQYLPQPDSLELEVQIKSAGTSTAADGQVDIANIKGGQPPYILSWSTGATGATLSGVPPGSYSLTVTDANQCRQTFYFEVEFTTALPPKPSTGTSRLFPNPIATGGTGRLETEASAPILFLELLDSRGRRLWFRPWPAGSAELAIEAPKVPGIYLLNLLKSTSDTPECLRWMVY